MVRRGRCIDRAVGDLLMWLAHYYGVREVTNRSRGIGGRKRCIGGLKWGVIGSCRGG